MEFPAPGDASLQAAAAVETGEASVTLSLAAQLESLLYAAGEPAALSALAAALDATPGEVEAALEELSAQYQARGIRLQRLGNRVRLATAPEMAERIQKFLGLEETNRLSQAALETLAIIAYNQPITKPQLEMIRGVNCDGVIHTLIARNLVQELGRADTVGHPMRYGVSFDFLGYFGLRGVHELPPVERLDALPIQGVPAAGGQS
jgi:segregation and condensation protein B